MHLDETELLLNAVVTDELGWEHVHEQIHYVNSPLVTNILSAIITIMNCIMQHTKQLNIIEHKQNWPILK